VVPLTYRPGGCAYPMPPFLTPASYQSAVAADDDHVVVEDRSQTPHKLTVRWEAQAHWD